MGDLLGILTHQNFDASTIFNNEYRFEQTLKANYPLLQVFTFSDSCGTQLFFIDFLEIFSRLWENENIRKTLADGYVPGNTLGHPCTAEGWRIYDLKRKELERKYSTAFFLVAPMFFIDEYEIEHWVKTKVWGIYFSLGNLPASEIDSPRRKYLICLVPPEACLDDAIKTVIVSRCQQMEKGYSLKIGDKALNI
jgi:hypothetical protein